MKRRTALHTLALATAAPSTRAAEGAAPWAALRQGPAIVLMRHANAPGVGDPPNFNLSRCDTQRNLDDAGRRQARAIGATFQRQGVKPAAVWASQWCRCQDTAREAFGAEAKAQPAFNSFFAEREQGAAQTATARRLLLAWRGPGVLVVVTHQVNITALTGNFAGSGEAVVLRPVDGELHVLGRLTPQ